MPYAVEMQHIVKRFGSVLANDDVSFSVEEGEIHGLIGENGAGKSTIMNILYGLVKPDGGTIRLFEKEVEIESPHKAIDFGIGMVHQHFMLMPDLTVLQNIILGRTPKKFGLIDNQAAIRQINEIIETYHLHVDLSAKVNQISVGVKQRVEIIKALYRGARILILDEPTAVLTPNETDKLMEVLLKLKEQGCTIIFITHKLREVMHITDRITVMRRGVVTGRMATSEANPKLLSEKMVGREVDLHIPMKPYQPGREILRVSDLSARNQRGLPALKQVSFCVREGEIVGIAGVEGNGQTELVEAITGMIHQDSGTILFEGESIERLSVRKRREKGMSHVPEDRLKIGVSKTCTIRDNLILNRYYQKPYCSAGVLDNDKLHELSETMCQDYQVKTPDSSYDLGTLSGGNMQKVVIARESEADPILMVAAQPTRGVDIGAIEYIHHKLGDFRDRGKAILLVSAELDEIMSLSDRILVMYEGEIVAEFQRGEADEHQIGLYMMGAKRQEGRVACNG